MEEHAACGICSKIIRLLSEYFVQLDGMALGASQTLISGTRLWLEDAVLKTLDVRDARAAMAAGPGR